MNSFQKIAAVSGPLCWLMAILISTQFHNPGAVCMAGVLVWVAIWWLTETVHLAVTALIPFVLIPLCGIADAKTISQQYMDPVIFLFMGGFFLSFAIEKWNLHSRLAFLLLSKISCKPSHILAGVMLLSYLLSFWISNTATVMMLYASVISLLVHIKNYFSSEKLYKTFASSLMIGLAYSASIGGLSTPVGTPTNMIFFSYYAQQGLPNGQINFLSWTVLGTIISFSLLLITYWRLFWPFKKINLDDQQFTQNFFLQKRKELGSADRNQKIITVIFVFTVLLWITKADLNIGTVHFHGWSGLLITGSYIHEATVSIGLVILLFFIPAKVKNGESPTTLLTWDDCARFPFSTLLVFGGGFSLAKGFENSGLSEIITGQLHHYKHFTPLALIFLICIIITVISEFASNVASIQIVLPVLFSLSKAASINPILIMIPATMAASMGFMMPVATAPNTIVYGSGFIKLKQMYGAGFLVNMAGIILITLFCYWLIPVLFS